MRHITAKNHKGPIDWAKFVEALASGHLLPPAVLEDVFLGPEGRTLLSRAAWIDGLGYGVKSVTVMAENAARNLPSVQGAMLVFDHKNGTPVAMIDSALVTNIKTASDSALGAKILAHPDSTNMLIVGAGEVARNVAEAYSVIFPNLQNISIWNRTTEKAERLAAELAAASLPAKAVTDLPDAASKADIIVTATMSRDPVISGDWVSAGTHVDLIGAFRAEMREADDKLLTKCRLFVDSRETTIDSIGELKIPLAKGIIKETDILADLYELSHGAKGRTSAQDITVFKNGGGAHLDLMTAFAILADNRHC